MSHDKSSTIYSLPKHLEHIVSGLVCIVLRFNSFCQSLENQMNEKGILKMATEPLRIS